MSFKQRNQLWLEPEVFVFSALRKRWVLGTEASAVLLLLAASVILLMPRKYESQTMLLVKNERQDPVVSADTNINTVRQNDLTETQVNSEIELLQSADVLRHVVLALHLDGKTPGAAYADMGSPSPAAIDKAVSKLRDNLAIEAVKKSDVVLVTYSAATPELAASVLRQLADTYLEMHLKVHNTPGTYTFFQNEADRYQRQLAQDEADLTLFRQQDSSLVIPEQQEILEQRAVNAEASFEESGVQVAQFQGKVRRAAEAISTLTPRITTQHQSAVNQNLLEHLNSTLVDLNNRRVDLLTKFRPDDRLVREVDEQIADTQAVLRRASSLTSTEEATDVNPVRQNAEKEMITAQTELTGLYARRSRLKNLVDLYKQRMFELAGAMERHQQLVRKVAEDEQNYLLYAKKREEARIAESLDAQRIANVAIAQEPTVPVKPASPRVLLDLVLSAFLSICIAASFVVLLEFWGSVNTPNRARMPLSVTVAVGD